MILGSLFGMNLDDLPKQVPFIDSMVATISLSVILLVAFVILSWESDIVPKQIEKATSIALDLDRIRDKERQRARSSLSLEIDRRSTFDATPNVSLQRSIEGI